MEVAHNQPVDCTEFVVREKRSCSESEEDRGTVRTEDCWISLSGNTQEVEIDCDL